MTGFYVGMAVVNGIIAIMNGNDGNKIAAVIGAVAAGIAAGLAVS